MYRKARTWQSNATVYVTFNLHLFHKGLYFADTRSDLSEAITITGTCSGEARVTLTTILRRLPLKQKKILGMQIVLGRF